MSEPVQSTVLTPHKPSLLRRLFAGIWRTLDFSRRLTVNLIFLLLLIIVFTAIFSGGHARIEPKTALVLNPEGAIVEQFSNDLMDRALADALGEDKPETQLRDLLQALDAAAKDSNIDRVLLVTHGITSMGPATTRELAAALKRFKDSKKKLYAFADWYDQRTYLLAAQADKIFLDPQGAVLIEGMGRYRIYYKDAFDKFGIDAHLFRVGEYKSAGEPFIRNDASEESKEADRYWMSDIWQRHLTDIAKARKLNADSLSTQIDNYAGLVTAAGGDLAKLAIEQKLVDGLMTREQIRELLIEEGIASEDGTSFRQVDLDSYLAHLKLIPTFPSSEQIAVVVAEGEILDGQRSPGAIGGDSTSALLKQVREDDDIKALVLRVDSPGGGVFPSELIRREVELIRESGKPVVVSMGDLAASGGYWISMNADEIIADPSTITGSIGIFGLFFNVPEAMGKLGLNTDGVGTTWLAGAFDPTRPLDPRVGEIIQQVLNKDYSDFVSKVAEARNQEESVIDSIARGRVWSGAQAKERGLVDRLGTLEDAIKSAAKRAKLDQYLTRYIEEEPNAFEALIANMAQTSIAKTLREQGWTTPLTWLGEKPNRALSRIQALMQTQHSGLPLAIQAHCECAVH